MRKRTVSKHYRFTPEEAADIRSKAQRTCLSERALISLLVKGFEPREKPDERFFEAMREMSAIGNNINQLAKKANSLNFIDAPFLEQEAIRWQKFRADVESVYLRPGKSNLRWQ